MTSTAATRPHPRQAARSSRPISRRGSTGCRWGRFHTLVVVALGITWILDGLEVTLAGAVAPARSRKARGCISPMPRSGSRAAPISRAPCWARCSSAGSPTGSGASGCSSSRSRVYLVATAATALVVESVELRAVPLPHRRRHRRRIHRDQFDHPGARSRRATAAGPISSSTAASGSAPRVGAAASIVLLDPALLPPDLGWRVAFLIGAALGLVIFLMRMWIPESPRWLMTHGRVDEANAIARRHRGRLRARGHRLPMMDRLPVMRLAHAPLHAAGGGRQHAFSRRAPAHPGRLDA
mgnify:CR=1 FL=1